jgi:hypothetical protein
MPPGGPVSSGHPVQVTIPHQASYSRGLALLGVPFLYLRQIALIPVSIVLFVVGIAAFITALVMQFVVLFTGSYPEGAHSFVSGLLRLGARTVAWEFGLVDRYPGFSLQPGDHPVQMSIAHASEYSRGFAVLGCILFIGRAIALIPVLVVVYILGIASVVVAWIMQIGAVFTGRYPEGAHRFVSGFVRLDMRAQAWMLGLVDQYPGFSLQP